MGKALQQEEQQILGSVGYWVNGPNRQMPMEGDAGQVLASCYCFPASPLPNPPLSSPKEMA